MKEDRTVNREKSTEAEALMRIHGLSLKEACTVVGLEPERYWGTDAPLNWLPTPDDIERLTRPLRAEKARAERAERRALAMRSPDAELSSRIYDRNGRLDRWDALAFSAPLSAAPQHAGWRKPPGLARIPRQARSIRIQVLETPLRTVERLAKRLSQRERATFSTCGNAANRRPVRSGTR